MRPWRADACAYRAAGLVASDPYTVKLEGVKSTGYRTISIAGIRDPILIDGIDAVLDAAIRQVRDRTGFAGTLRVHVYGKNGVMGALEPQKNPSSHELGLVMEAIAPDPEEADTVCSLLRSTLLHIGYPGRISTAGNLALLYSPSDISCGQVYEFNIYHLMEVDDPKSLVSYKRLRGELMETVPLTDLAAVIRSKNAGPYELTVDILFKNREDYLFLKESNYFTRELFARIYGIEVDKILALVHFDPASAVKCTMVRPVISGVARGHRHLRRPAACSRPGAASSRSGSPKTEGGYLLVGDYWRVGSPLPIAIHSGNQLIEYSFSILSGHLACPDLFMASAAVFQHEIAHIRFACLLYNAVAAGKNSVLLVLAPDDLDADVTLRVHGVQQKAIARIDFCLRSKIQQNHVCHRPGVLLQHVPEEHILLQVAF